MKKVSIIIAVYNVDKYLDRCLRSVTLQKGNDIEIIIVNDGSTDESLNICKKYQKKDKRIKIISQKNAGLSNARNVGFQHSTGEYIWHIDGDDYIDDDSIDVLRKYINQYDIIVFRYYKIVQESIVKVVEKTKFDNIIDKYVLTNPVVWNKVIKRSLLENNSFPNGCTKNDIYVIPTLITKTNSIIFIDDYLYYYVIRNTSISFTKKINMDDCVFCLEHVYDILYKEYPDVCECFCIYRFLTCYYNKNIQSGLSYDFKLMNRILKKMFPKYYKNKYFNKGFLKKIYYILIYYDMNTIVRILTFFKIKVFQSLR